MQAGNPVVLLPQQGVTSLRPNSAEIRHTHMTLGMYLAASRTIKEEEEDEKNSK